MSKVTFACVAEVSATESTFADDCFAVDDEACDLIAAEKSEACWSRLVFVVTGVFGSKNATQLAAIVFFAAAADIPELPVAAGELAAIEAGVLAAVLAGAVLAGAVLAGAVLAGAVAAGALLVAAGALVVAVLLELLELHAARAAQAATATAAPATRDVAGRRGQVTPVKAISFRPRRGTGVPRSHSGVPSVVTMLFKI
jgi:hypothetical protein